MNRRKVVEDATVDRTGRYALNEAQSVVENRSYAEPTREFDEAAPISETSEVNLSGSQNFNDVDYPSDLYRSTPLRTVHDRMYQRLWWREHCHGAARWQHSGSGNAVQRGPATITHRRGHEFRIDCSMEIHRDRPTG
ncbi:unannotated protein [freshwater metagenome]|uniref:Unannotated protein n=1 Tax=freshwater metagenome TaxID=449393 RepID=A0A6J5YC03_9ZZZZ